MRTFVLSLVLSLAVPIAALAATGLALHAVERGTSPVECDSGVETLECDTYNTAADLLTTYTVYLVANQEDPFRDGITGAGLGIEYPESELGVFSWTRCADFDFPSADWPAPGSGNVVTFGSCQVTRIGGDYQALLGSFYVYAYSPTNFEITPRTTVDPPDLILVDCDNAEEMLSSGAAGRVAFSSGASIPGYNPCSGFDVTPPQLVSAGGDLGASTVRVAYSEAVTSSAENPGNYILAPSDEPTAPVTILDAAFVPDGFNLAVDLTLAGTLENRLYRLEVSNVQDVAGVPIDPMSTVEFLPRGGDVTPPQVSGASGTLGDPEVVLHFSESLNATAENPANYVFDPPLAVLNASRLGSNVVLTVNPAPTESSYRIFVNDVEDLLGNPIAPGAFADFVPEVPDITGPQLVSAESRSTLAEATVTFDEDLGNGATNIANYEIYPQGGPGSQVSILGAFQSSPEGVTLSLSTTLEPILHTVRVNNVEDLLGNPVAPDATLDFEPISGTLFYTAAGDAGGDEVVLTFNQAPSSEAGDPENYTVSRNGLVLPVASLADNGTIVTLTLGTVLAPNIHHQVEARNIRDSEGYLLGTPVVSFVPTGQGGGGFNDPKVALHANAPVFKGACGFELPPCTEFTTQLSNQIGTVHYVYVVLVDQGGSNSGFSGAGFGINYDESALYVAWTLCADQEFSSTSWPGPNSGNVTTWADCESDIRPGEVQAVPGFFYVYAYGQQTVMQVIPRPAEGALDVVDCDLALVSLFPFEDAGIVGFGVAGFNPCFGNAVGVRSMTWGSIKRTFSPGLQPKPGRQENRR